MHCYKKLLIFFSIIFLGPSASTTTTTTTLPSGNVFWRYSQKKFWKKLELDWPHYTTPERSKKNIKQEKNRENAAKTISPPNHKKNGLYTMFAAALLISKRAWPVISYTV